MVDTSGLLHPYFLGVQLFLFEDNHSEQFLIQDKRFIPNIWVSSTVVKDWYIIFVKCMLNIPEKLFRKKGYVWKAGKNSLHKISKDIGI